MCLSFEPFLTVLQQEVPTYFCVSILQEKKCTPNNLEVKRIKKARCLTKILFSFRKSSTIFKKHTRITDVGDFEKALNLGLDILKEKN
jgi:hypothetical protein